MEGHVRVALPFFKFFGDALTYLIVRLVVCVVQSISPESCRQWARLLAYLAHRVIRFRENVIEENLRTAFPQWDTQQRQKCALLMWEHLFLMTFEIVHAPHRIRVANWRQHFTIDELSRFADFLLSPGPKLIVSGHLGNFELGGYVAALLGFPTYTIARPLDNPFLDRLVNRFRTQHGQVILPKKGSTSAVEAVLRTGGVVAVLGDQYAGPKGCWVEFFGKPASSHKAIALFCLVHRAKLAVVVATRGAGFMQMNIRLMDHIDPDGLLPAERDVTALTQRYHRALERAICDVPEQYWWVHRRWKGPPPATVMRNRVAAA